VTRRFAVPHRGDDAGITLIELMVTMTIMSIFMAMFTTGIVEMYRSANKAEAASVAQAQIHIAFLRLDKEIRYAASISEPGPVGADSYVEYLTSYTGSPLCTELRLHVAEDQLQHRSWSQPVGSAVAAPSEWIPLASDVTSASPFIFSGASGTSEFQQLQLSLVATSGSGETLTTRTTDVTFTALNTSRSTSSKTVCAEGRSIP
jgi:prepilin-type N-terminal cleavage/methylation domain-containing protein